MAINPQQVHIIKLAPGLPMADSTNWGPQSLVERNTNRVDGQICVLKGVFKASSVPSDEHHQTSYYNDHQCQNFDHHKEHLHRHCKANIEAVQGGERHNRNRSHALHQQHRGRAVGVEDSHGVLSETQRDAGNASRSHK
ncbi:hypothetical protein EYF80_011013 [Liparis tanakae]|uniref:Uncharacterized protein n=1 Tax=Liparis tanakae TaxID=230148 RepID=A0A4Z2INT7_9TELE|nr:hypothetical protein EYF80_011013 [Liparis tanakae]